MSVGGSLIVPDQIDTEFLSTLKRFVDAETAEGRRFIIIAGGGRTARRYQDAAAAVTELTTADFDVVIQNGVTLVDFWAPWCGPCRMQVPVLEQVASRLGLRARVAIVNVDQHPELAGRFRITGIPTLLLFKDGRLVREFVGLQSAPALIAALEAVSQVEPA